AHVVTTTTGATQNGRLGVMGSLRRLALVVALVLLASSCGHPKRPSIAADSSTTAAGGASGTTARSGGSLPSASTPAGRPITTVAPRDVPAAAPNTAGPPGSAAPFFLRPAPATTLVVEISAEKGAEPQPSTVQHVASVLSAASGKPVETTRGGVPPSHATWTAADVNAAASAVKVTAQGDHAVFRLLFVHGQWAADDHVLGISVRGDTAAIFSDAVAGAADPITGPAAIEVAVTTHEVGHLLGLVDLYLDTGRADPQHPGHSTNKGSVMYWAVESTLVTDLLTGGPPRDFDAADKADLARIRGGAHP
ncbi:MAG: hypothetical protein QOI47_585, partial [Actinomycetota bacterium]|nr:hypothetical protein [Actinomycetota bacterium]